MSWPVCILSASPAEELISLGDIGRLTIELPWQALGSQPARVNIQDVYLLARARPQGKVDPVEDDKREQAAKQDRLRSAEAVDQAATQLDLEAGDGAFLRVTGTQSRLISTRSETGKRSGDCQ